MIVIFFQNAKDIDNIDSDDSKGEYDDDKATRLTLMEQILLLGLKDREVSFFSNVIRNIVRRIFMIFS